MIIKCIKHFSSKQRRVVVTGLGSVNPLGVNCRESWDNIISYKSGIRDLSEEKYAHELPSKCKIGAPIPKSFNSKKYRTLGTDNLLTQMTMSAAEEAVLDSKLEFDKKLKYRTV